jgi:hypothetical protein
MDKKWLAMDYVHGLTEYMPGVEFVRPSAQKVWLVHKAFVGEFISKQRMGEG